MELPTSQNGGAIVKKCGNRKKGGVNFIRILTGFFYLAVILDLFSRKVIGWALFTVPIQSSL